MGGARNTHEKEKILEPDGMTTWVTLLHVAEYY
jgi:hypothetical protein